MQITKEQKDTAWFIDTVLIKGVKDAATHGGEYLSFSLITQGLETLGALLDNHPIEAEGHSAKRFKAAVNKWMPQAYHSFNNLTRNDPYYLYGGLRCGMAHIMRPQKSIMLTGRSNLYSNLDLSTFGSDQYLIIVAEDLLADYLTACEQAKLDLPTLPKGQDYHLTIYTVEEEDIATGDYISHNLSADCNPTHMTGQYIPPTTP